MAVSGYDASIPLEYGIEDGFYKLNKTINSTIQQDIKMLLLTNPGERVVLPDYGVGLRNYLFENTPEKPIAERIKNQINLYLPDIRIRELTVERDLQKTPNKFGQSGNNLFVKLVYFIPATSVLETFELLEESFD